MKSIYTFLIRVVLSGVLAVIIGHFFFKDITNTRTLGLAFVLLVLAYLFEYTKKRDGGKTDGQ